MAYFLLRLSPPRPGFPFDATADEKALFSEHSGYWLERAGDGAAIAVGPVFEEGGAWGLAEADPVIRAGAGFAYALAPVPSLILRR